MCQYRLLTVKYESSSQQMQIIKLQLDAEPPPPKLMKKKSMKTIDQTVVEVQDARVSLCDEGLKMTIQVSQKL